MRPSAQSPGINHGFVATTLIANDPAPRPDDASSTTAGSTTGGGADWDLREATRHADWLEAKWQSAIDAATD